MKNSKVAIRYAKSLLQLSIERNILDESFEDMQLVSNTITASRDFELMLSSPIIQPSQKVKALEAIFAGKIGELSQNFIKSIAMKGREKMMKDIVEEFVAQVKTHKNIVEAHVVSATALDESNREKIRKIVSQSHNGTVELIEKVNPELIGGFILKVGDQMIDASVANKLKKLKREFVGDTHVKALN